MKRLQTLVTTACLLLAAGGLFVAWREQAAARRAEAALAVVKAELASAATKARVRARPTAAAETASGRPPPAAEKRDDPPRMGPRNFPPDFSGDPELAPLLLKQRQRQMTVRYAPLFARLGLPAETQEKLATLLADKQLSRFEAMGLARRQGLGREEALALAQQSDAEADTAVRALLGDTAYTQLQQYDSTYAQRATVNTIASQLSYSGAALTAAQQEQLIEVLAANKTVAPPAGGFGPPGGRPGGGGRDTTEEEAQTMLAAQEKGNMEALAQAANFLTPAQLEAVRQAQAAQLDQLRLSALMSKRLRRAGPPPGGD